MVVYVEYAFLENFLFDGALLCLSLIASKQRFQWKKVLFSALFGAVFAIIFPLLYLPLWLGFLLKILVGFLLCLLAFGRLKTKKEWGRYATTASFFFAFTFAFGGALTGVYTSFSLLKMPNFAVVIGFCLLCFCASVFILKIYEKKRVFSYIYPCKVLANGKNLSTHGFFDSGNLAIKNGLPVCFIAADFFYEIWGNEIVFSVEDTGQVRDEMQIETVSGIKKIPLFQGEIEIKTGAKERRKKSVYFAPTTNMIQREYKLLLSARLFDGWNRKIEGQNEGQNEN